MEDLQFVLQSIGVVTILSMLYSLPYMLRKLNAHEKLNPPEITFLFLYVILGIGLGGWLINGAYLLILMGVGTGLSYAWAKLGWILLLIPVALIFILAMIGNAKRKQQQKSS